MKRDRVIGHRALRLGRLELYLRLRLNGRCDEECGYGNFWCPNGCPENIELDKVAWGPAHPSYDEMGQ